MKKLLLLFPAVVFAAMLPPASAQGTRQPEDAISQGLRDAYQIHQQGNTDALVAKLRELIKLAEEEGARRLATRLPDRLGDWTGGELRTEQLAALGGGTSLTRTYSNGDKRITIRAVRDSPLANRLATALGNESLLALAGRRTTRISGQTAVFEGDRKLQMLPGPNLFLELEGNEAVRENDLTGLARRLDLRSIAEIGKAGGAAEAE